MQIHAACREGEAWKITPRQLWAGIGRGGQASQSRSHMQALHARSRMQNAAHTCSASCRRKEVVVEERQVDLDLTSTLRALETVLGKQESEVPLSCALGKG